MRGSNFGYLIKEGARNVYMNRLMSFASIGTLMACMLLIGSAMLLSMNINSVVGLVERQNDVEIILLDDLSEEKLAEIDRQISEISNIYERMFVDKDQLLEEQKAQMGAQAVYLEGLEGEENPLFDSYRVRLRDVASIGTTLLQLESIDGVDKVMAQTDVAEVVTSVKRAVYVGGFFIVGILLVVSLVIIANTIKVTVFNRRKEISIMKCVGATDSFIRLPFLIEGFLIGLLSASLAFAALWIGYDYVMDVISANTSSWIQSAYQSMITFESVAIELGGWFAGGGIFVGVFGSLFFVGKYLKV